MDVYVLHESSTPIHHTSREALGRMFVIRSFPKLLLSVITKHFKVFLVYDVSLLVVYEHPVAVWTIIKEGPHKFVPICKSVPWSDIYRAPVN